jgi:hypothetical protein
MKYDVTGIDSNGDEQTLETDVASEAEARKRAEGYGIRVTSIAGQGEKPHAVTPSGPLPIPASRSRRQVMTALSVIFGLLYFGLRIAMRSSAPKTHQLTPGEMDFINEKIHPKLPDWAEDAKRQSDAALAEVRRAKAERAATQPATTPQP